MAIDANSTTVLAALLGASITAIVSAIEKTHAQLHAAARPDTLKVFAGKAPLPSISDAITRRRTVLGPHAAEVDHG